MTTYATITPATFVSEREAAHLWVDGHTPDDGHYEDCVDCCLVMLAALAKPGINASHKEAETLRWKAGLPALGGTYVAEYETAFKNRYGLTLTVFNGTDAALLAAIPVGYAAAICGNPASTPAGSPFKTYLPNFNGGHCILVAHYPSGWLLVDSMGPQDGVYHGQSISDADLKAFYTNGANGDVGILPIAIVPDPAPEESMLTNLDLPAVIQFDAPIGAQCYDEAGAPLFQTGVAITARPSMYSVSLNGVSYRVFAGSDGSTRRLLLIKATDCKNVKPLASGGFTQADIDSAVAKQKAADDAAAAAAAKAAAAAAASAHDLGVEDEKAAIRAKLGL